MPPPDITCNVVGTVVILNTAAAEIASACAAESNLVCVAPALCVAPLSVKFIVFTAGNEVIFAG